MISSCLVLLISIRTSDVTHTKVYWGNQTQNVILISLVARVRFFTLAHFIRSSLSISRTGQNSKSQILDPSTFHTQLLIHFMCRVVSSTRQQPRMAFSPPYLCVQSRMAFSPLPVRTQSYSSKLCNLGITGISPSVASLEYSS
jgi:hypothetical protein